MMIGMVMMNGKSALGNMHGNDGCCVANANVLTQMFALAGHPVAVHLRPQV